MILFGPLPGDLGRDQLPVERLIIVVLVHVQVHLGHLLPELRGLHLLLQLLILFLLIGHVSSLWCVCLRLTNLLLLLLHLLILLLEQLVSVLLYSDSGKYTAIEVTEV